MNNLNVKTKLYHILKFYIESANELVIMHKSLILKCLRFLIHSIGTLSLVAPLYIHIII